ncbi:MAG: hypothetical protein V9E96_14705 [Chitinophagaceae bacterium]
MNKETELFKHLELTTATVLSSLEEPFFMQFGSENIVTIITKNRL